MATTVTELVLAVNTNVERPNWALNVTSDDVSSAEVIKAGATKRHCIEKIAVTYKSGGTNWFKILDGTSELIGPVVVADGVPWVYMFHRSIFGTVGTNLRIKTQAAGDIHVLIEGFTEV